MITVALPQSTSCTHSPSLQKLKTPNYGWWLNYSSTVEQMLQSHWGQKNPKHISGHYSCFSYLFTFNRCLSWHFLPLLFLFLILWQYHCCPLQLRTWVTQKKWMNWWWCPLKLLPLSPFSQFWVRPVQLFCQWSWCSSSFHSALSDSEGAGQEVAECVLSTSHKLVSEAMLA